MVRTIYTPKNRDFTFSVPQEYIGKTLEILVSPLEYMKKRKPTFSAVALDTAGYKFNREEANTR